MLEESLVLEGESTSDLARSRVFGFETGDLGRLDLLEDEDEDEAFRSAGCPGALRFMLSDGWPCKEVLLPKELLNKKEWVLARVEWNVWKLERGGQTWCNFLKI